MDGIHDLGGKQGFGTVEREPDEPAFHHRWEASVFAMVNAAAAMGALRNIDQFRHAVERIDPAAYLTHGYYGRWLGGVETLLREAGLVDAAEIEARLARLPQSRGADPTAPPAARPAEFPDRISYGSAAAGSPRRLNTPPRFAPGDPVHTAAYGKRGHTRLPGYARGRAGTITAHHGGWVFPDSNAHGLGEQPQHLYTVSFSSEALWGDDAEPGVTVSLDLFESYLEEGS